MTLSKEQFAKLVENYVSFMMDGMDTETMQVMVYDLLTREYETYTEEQIVGEIEELYGEEVAAEFYNDVAVVEVSQMTEDYQVFEWYAAQMDLTVDYLLDEFFIDGNLILPSELVKYDYECVTS